MTRKLGAIALVIVTLLSCCACAELPPDQTVQARGEDATTTAQTVQTTTAVPTVSAVKEVKLADSILEAAIKDFENRPDWGINLSKISTNYRAGVKLTGYIVLHNGSDSERMVTLSCKPTTTKLTDSTTKVSYSTTPDKFQMEWVEIGDQVVRLKRQETKTVGVSLLVPAGTDLNQEFWSFYVNADGQSINQYTQKSIVTTEANDHTLELKLNHPLLKGDLAAIKGIKSDLDETLKITSYNPLTDVLTIEGFTELTKRNLSLDYEWGSQTTISYNQIWFLTMI